MNRTIISVAALMMLGGCSDSTPTTNVPSVSSPVDQQNGGDNTVTTINDNVATDFIGTSNPARVGFYGCAGDQVSETAGFVNAHWECWWGADGNVDEALGIARMKQAQLPTTIDVAHRIFRPGADSGLRPDAEFQLRDLLNIMREKDALHLVEAIVAIDEPNLPQHRQSGSIHDAVALIRRVAADYHELDGFKISLVFCTFEPMIGIEVADRVYFDDYKIVPGADGEPDVDPVIKHNGWADKIDKMLRPGQEMGLMPGVSDMKYRKADIDSYIRKAKSFSRTVHIACFMWRPPVGAEGLVGLCDQPLLLTTYRSAFKSVV